VQHGPVSGRPRRIGLQLPLDLAQAARRGAMHSGANQRVLRSTWPLVFALVLALEELNVDFGAVDTDEFALAIGQAGRR
jgi:hypothetical protein